MTTFGTLASPRKAGVQFERAWVMPNRYTFIMAPVDALLVREMSLPIEGSVAWADPFAGLHSPATHRNDLDPHANAESHEDALTWLGGLPTEGFEGVLLDPPYSLEQCERTYKQAGKYKGTVGFAEYIHATKDEAARVVKRGGKAITFGWNSCGLGVGRGFVLLRGLLLCHGDGGHRDTIITVEVKE